MADKMKKQIDVAKAILDLIDQDGIKAITHSKISRKSGVSRSWIYEYIGKEKATLVEYAVELFASEMAKMRILKVPKNKDQLESQLNEGIDILFDAAANNPVVIKIYFRFRGSENPIGSVIKKHENKWIEGAVKSIVRAVTIPHEQAVMLAELALTLRLGFAHRFITSKNPDQSRKRAEDIFRFLHSVASGLS